MNAVWTTYIEAYPVPAGRHWGQVLLVGNGGANLLFWPTFVAYGLVPMGIVAAAGHALFLGLELVAVGARSVPDRRRR